MHSKLIFERLNPHSEPSVYGFKPSVLYFEWTVLCFEPLVLSFEWTVLSFEGTVFDFEPSKIILEGSLEFLAFLRFVCNFSNVFLKSLKGTFDN